MGIITSWSEYENKYGTSKGYYKQFETPKIELNKIYVVHPKSWQECIVKIVAIYEDVALAVEIRGLSIGRKQLYHYGDTEKHGWKYQDLRYNYRLQTVSK